MKSKSIKYGDKVTLRKGPIITGKVVLVMQIDNYKTYVVEFEGGQQQRFKYNQLRKLHPLVPV